MDWKDKVKEKATDAAQSKAIDSVAKEHGNTAAGLASDGIDATKTGDAQQFAQKQKLAAQQRAREVAERKYRQYAKGWIVVNPLNIALYVQNT